jgi:hypothetical protein
MSSPKTLSLKVSDLTQLDFEFYDIYDYILASGVQHGGTPICNLCGVNEKTADDLCSVCHNALAKFTEFRNEDFTLTLNINTVRWTSVIQENCGRFTAKFDRFTAVRVGDMTIQFEANIPKGTQLLIPFEEFQLKLS